MIVIRTAEEMARALDSPLDPELTQLLKAHWERLSKYDAYDLSELAEFVIAQQGDTLGETEAVLSIPLIGLEAGQPHFTLGPEIIAQHSSWLELVFVYSDDGYGLVLLIELGPKMDPLLCAASRHELDRAVNHSAG